MKKHISIFNKFGKFKNLFNSSISFKAGAVPVSTLAITLAMTMTLSLTSCSESYLDLAPQNAATEAELFASPEYAQYVVTGTYKLFQQQYLSTQGLNGEGSINLYYSDLTGNDMFKENWTSNANILNCNFISSTTNKYNYYPWFYCYKLIGNCNMVIQYAPAKGENAHWDYVVAQAKTIRAYLYMRLSAIYCQRWSDAQGNSRGLPLRLDSSLDPIPASSLKEVYQQIYSDLDDAIDRFNTCGYDERSSVENRWYSGAEVAHAVYSRAALYRQDWQNCVTHSQAARQGTSIMGESEYLSGFYNPNKEWIWYAFCDATQGLHYYAFAAYAATNANTTVNRSYPTGMSKELFNSIPETDTRKWLTIAPTLEELPESEWSADCATSAHATANKAFNTRAWDEYGKRLVDTGKQKTTIFYYICTKFQAGAANQYGYTNLCLFRAAEMYYNEAEALFRLGNETEARKCLETVTQPYDAAYTCTASGNALLEEILRYRRFDLWGEGHAWFDLKRNGGSVVRKSWTEGGNWISNFISGNCGPTDKNNWTYYYPAIETDYNPLVTNFAGPDWSAGN